MSMDGRADEPPQQGSGLPVAGDGKGPDPSPAPTLAGSGRIGSAVRVLGAGRGMPGGPVLQWCRDGVAIPGATAAVYLPRAEDDGSALTCRVGLPGGGMAVTPPLPVTYEPPALAAEPFEEIFDQGSGPQEVAAAPWFTGEALRFAAAGAGAGVDPRTGVLSIPTEAPLADLVTVTARNSGGSAAGSFFVTIEGEAFELPAMTAAEWEVSAVREIPGGPLVEMIRVLAGPALAATRLYRSARGDTLVADAHRADTAFDGMVLGEAGAGFEPCVKHPGFDDSESPFYRCWMGRRHGAPDRAEALAPGARRSTVLRYSLDPTAVPLEEAVFSADSDARLWMVREPAPEAATHGWSALPMLGKAEVEAFVNKGVLSGDAGQYMLAAGQSESDPDRIYTGQDGGGVWVSLDHGNSWNNLLSRGLYARSTTGIAVDPLDARRVFLLTQGGSTGAAKHIGLQRSLDGGLSWERVIPNDESPGRAIQSPINFAPTSKDAGLGYATRWYCIIQKHSMRNQGDRPHEFHRSDDGGATWRLVRPLAPRTYGSITHLVVSPTDPEAVYVYSGMGLWRFEAASEPEGKITRLSGTNGLPAGGVKDRIYLGADGRSIIAGVDGQGVFRSDDAGASWSLVHADPDIGKLHVNPWEPQRMIISYGKGRQLKVSTDGGVSFAEPDRVSTGPGGRDDGTIGQLTCLVVWHPKNPDRIWAHGGPMHWQSDDGGRNWRPANGYFNGKQHQNWFIDQMFDPVDPDRFGYFMTDFGVAMTRNGGLWFEQGRMVTRALDLKHSTVNGGALHPDPARKTLLASVGKMNSGKLLISRDDGATWAIASDGERRRQYVGFDLDDPSYAFQWRERSTDHGVSWSEMKSLPEGFAVSGMTLTAKGMRQGQAIFAIDRDSGNSGRSVDQDDDGSGRGGW